MCACVVLEVCQKASCRVISEVLVWEGWLTSQLGVSSSASLCCMQESRNLTLAWLLLPFGIWLQINKLSKASNHCKLQGETTLSFQWSSIVLKIWFIAYVWTSYKKMKPMLCILKVLFTRNHKGTVIMFDVFHTCTYFCSCWMGL